MEVTENMSYNVSLSELIKYLYIVKKQIIDNSMYKNTLIIVNNFQFSLCDFREEGLAAAIIEWASKAFDFVPTVIENTKPPAMLGRIV